MAVAIRKVDDKPILIAEYADPFGGVTDVNTTLDEIAKYYSEDLPIFIVISVTNELALQFSDMMIAMQEASKGTTKVKLSAPNIKVITVTNNELHRLGAEAFQQEQYGGITMPVFETLDEALETADQLIADAAS